jgi:hypothetical protein
MEIEGSNDDTHNDGLYEQQQESPSQAGSPPPIVLTYSVALFYLSRLSAKLVPTSADRGCHVVSVTDPLRPDSRISRPSETPIDFSMYPCK